MASTDVDLEKPQVEGDKPSANRVAEYLQSPRKKKKSFVVMALSKRCQDEFAGPVESFVRASFKGTALSHPATPEELVKNFGRQIVLVVYDDEFMALNGGLETLRELKRRKAGTSVPVLFLTRDPERLISQYNQMLLPYHEGDDYIQYNKADLPQVLAKVRAGLTTRFRRRSRRYAVDESLQYYLLADDRMHAGRLLDLSVHGGLLRAEDGRVFRAGDQVKIHLPISRFLAVDDGDYLRLSAVVRRVLIGGTHAGVSFEHMSDLQTQRLTTYVIEMVNSQLGRRGPKPKAARP
jgi:hypothetical protein